MAILVTVLIGLIGAVLGIFATAPLPWSPIWGVDFSPQPVPSEIPTPRTAYPDTGNRLRDAEIRFLGDVRGPESLAFDPEGLGPYTGLSDGRVVRWRSEKHGERVGDKGEGGSWETFAVTSRERSASCGTGLEWEDVCGRPLGIRFDQKTGDLYIADAYRGLQRVGRTGGVGEVLLTEVEGQPLIFTNDLDIDSDGVVYFTDSSNKYRRRQFLLDILEAGSSGRLIKYNPKTGATEVLMRGLRFANGVALSRDESYLLICETTLSRIHRYWLAGPKAGSSEIFADLPGFPDNIRRGTLGFLKPKDGSTRKVEKAEKREDEDDSGLLQVDDKDFFWVAIHTRRSAVSEWISARPMVRTALLSLPISLRTIYISLFSKPGGLILGLSGEGKVLESLEDAGGKKVMAISEVEERVVSEEDHGKPGQIERRPVRRELWIGSVFNNYIAVYKL